MKTVTVKFAGMSGQTYAYMTDIEGIEVGDTLVVESASSGFICVTVTSVDDADDSIEQVTKWIVGKVDVAGYRDRLEKLERRKLLMAKLKKMQAEVLEADQFATLIKLVPGAAALVEELKALS
jgi:hypothetical protein